jgi:hypothetical protein
VQHAAKRDLTHNHTSPHVRHRSSSEDNNKPTISQTGLKCSRAFRCQSSADRRDKLEAKDWLFLVRALTVQLFAFHGQSYNLLTQRLIRRILRPVGLSHCFQHATSSRNRHAISREARRDHQETLRPGDYPTKKTSPPAQNRQDPSIAQSCCPRFTLHFASPL